MPNHVSSDLFVSGPAKSLAEFKEFAKDHHKYSDEEVILLSANKFIPYPEEFKIADELVHKWDADNRERNGKGKLKEGVNVLTQPKDGFNNGGYDWCLENWGTKWGIYSSELLEEDDNRLLYTFQTAWSPPIPVIKAMSTKFPDLLFRLEYFECAMGFQGIFEIANSEIQEDTSEDYDGDRGG